MRLIILVKVLEIIGIYLHLKGLKKIFAESRPLNRRTFSQEQKPYLFAPHLTPSQFYPAKVNTVLRYMQEVRHFFFHIFLFSSSLSVHAVNIGVIWSKGAGGGFFSTLKNTSAKPSGQTFGYKAPKEQSRDSGRGFWPLCNSALLLEGALLQRQHLQPGRSPCRRRHR
jgi:hypothetical protein